MSYQKKHAECLVVATAKYQNCTGDDASHDYLKLSREMQRIGYPRIHDEFGNGTEQYYGHLPIECQAMKDLLDAWDAWSASIGNILSDSD